MHTPAGVAATAAHTAPARRPRPVLEEKVRAYIVIPLNALEPHMRGKEVICLKIASAFH